MIYFLDHDEQTYLFVGGRAGWSWEDKVNLNEGGRVRLLSALSTKRYGVVLCTRDRNVIVDVDNDFSERVLAAVFARKMKLPDFMTAQDGCIRWSSRIVDTTAAALDDPTWGNGIFLDSTMILADVENRAELLAAFEHSDIPSQSQMQDRMARLLYSSSIDASPSSGDADVAAANLVDRSTDGDRRATGLPPVSVVGLEEFCTTFKVDEDNRQTVTAATDARLHVQGAKGWLMGRECQIYLYSGAMYLRSETTVLLIAGGKAIELVEQTRIGMTQKAGIRVTFRSNPRLTEAKVQSIVITCEEQTLSPLLTELQRLASEQLHGLFTFHLSLSASLQLALPDEPFESHMRRAFPTAVYRSDGVVKGQLILTDTAVCFLSDTAIRQPRTLTASDYLVIRGPFPRLRRVLPQFSAVGIFMGFGTDEVLCGGMSRPDATTFFQVLADLRDAYEIDCENGTGLIEDPTADAFFVRSEASLRFDQLFPVESDTCQLSEAFSCSLLADPNESYTMGVSGVMYLTEQHICFASSKLTASLPIMDAIELDVQHRHTRLYSRTVRFVVKRRKHGDIGEYVFGKFVSEVGARSRLVSRFRAFQLEAQRAKKVRKEPTTDVSLAKSREILRPDGGFEDHEDEAERQGEGVGGPDGGEEEAEVELDLGRSTTTLADMFISSRTSLISSTGSMHGPSVANGRPMTILLLTVGTRGDVQPYLHLARRLRQDGHSMIVATHEEHRAFVEAAVAEPGPGSLGYLPIAGDPAELMALCVEQQSVAGIISKGLAEFGSWLQELLDSTTVALANCPKPLDAILSSPVSFVGPHLAEATGAKFISIFTMPFTKTAAFPNPLACSPILESPAYNLATHMALDQGLWLPIKSRVNEWRVSQLHLRPLARPPVYQPAIYCYSRYLCPEPADWPNSTQAVGFFFNPAQDTTVGSTHHTDYKPPDDLAAFLAAGEPPVYIGFGSVTALSASARVAFRKALLGGLSKAGRRAILLGGWVNEIAGEDGTVEPLPDTVLQVGPTPHEWLFARCSAVVCHGGAGTVATALSAGCPVIVCAFFGDQFFWCGRLADRKVGLGCGATSLTSRKFKYYLEEVHDPANEYPARARALGARIRRERGVHTAAFIIEQLVQQHRTQSDPVSSDLRDFQIVG
jgi:UDP:flavonoid glycosyltransferase YjiC (YdhE family)